jgi:hypothetical protein
VEGAGLLSGPVTYVHPTRRMGHDRVHGILVGNVLIDVAEAARPQVDDGRLGSGDDVADAAAERSLEARADGRPVAVIRSYRDVQLAVDRAVRSARDVLRGART